VPLTPLDIYNKEFKSSFRGYQQDEVDEFLDEVRRDYEALLLENEDLKQQLAGVGERIEQYKKLEETLKNTLVVAQATADEVRAAARKEADLIIREAEQRAKEILDEAQSRVRELEARLQEERREWDTFRARVRALLMSQLSLLEQGSADAAETPAEKARVLE
jgi:cell division initiation protein